MAVNYNDDRLVEVKNEEKAALTQNEQMFNDINTQVDKYYKDLQASTEAWGASQAASQQAQTDFAIEKINQQKEQAHKDYIKEQSGAYVDWQKQSNQYGANAEQQASAGLVNTGYSESSQVSMYNTYQNRVASARDVYNRTILEYDNAIKEARLQNNSILADIAYQTMQAKLELGLQGFQYKNDMLLQKVNTEMTLKNMYHSQYMDVLDQINTENALAEQIRQFNKSYELDLKQYQLQQAQLEEEKRQFNATMAAKTLGAASSGSASVKKGTTSTKTTKSTGKTATKATSHGGGGRSFATGSDNKATMNSIIGLGYGPISAKGLAELVNSGQVKEYTENGVTKFKRTDGKSASTMKGLTSHYSANSSINNTLKKLFK